MASTIVYMPRHEWQHGTLSTRPETTYSARVVGSTSGPGGHVWLIQLGGRPGYFGLAEDSMKETGYALTLDTPMIGPFDTEEEAETALLAYLRLL